GGASAAVARMKRPTAAMIAAASSGVGGGLIAWAVGRGGVISRCSGRGGVIQRSSAGEGVVAGVAAHGDCDGLAWAAGFAGRVVGPGPGRDRVRWGRPGRGRGRARGAAVFGTVIHSPAQMPVPNAPLSRT